jgi:hypothetical protein
MTGAVLDRPRAAPGRRPCGDERPGGEHPVPGGRVTLAELLTATLHETRTNGSAECPVCHARMTPAPARDAAAAECASCGSRLS